MSPQQMAKLKFKDYPAEQLLINSIRSRLNAEESRVRDAILAEIIRLGKPCDVYQLQLEGIADPVRIVHQMIAERIVVPDGDTTNIAFAYPVSAMPTAHKVFLADGRSFHAMCALDAMGSSFTFQQDVRISSQCAECGEAIFMEIMDGQIADLQPHSVHILHADLRVSNNWAGSC